jgi:hypothetical protein
MFASDSRYAKQPIYTVKMPDGREVSAVVPPLPRQTPLAGYHRRIQGERLDLIAARYLKNATFFWVLCDADNAPVPAALAERDLIGIPRSSGGGAP